jgi:mannose-6-phosphate isomerase
VTCPYFVTHLLELDAPVRREHAARDSFVILICMEGDAILSDDQGYTLAIRRGQTVLYAASTQWIQIHPQPQCRMLEVYYNA